MTRDRVVIQAEHSARAAVPRLLGLVLLVATALVLAGCSITSRQTYDQVDLDRATGELPAEQLLDVGIVLFDPGLGKDGEGNEDKFIFPEVRQAEARYIPYHLKTTLEASGHWGSVWVLPERSEAVDVTVWGRIDRSDGLNAVLRVAAWDATGREWFNQSYSAQVPEKAYSKLRDPSQDPYQAVYNQVANDLLAARRKLAARELTRIRDTATLRYGADLVPAAFADYLEREKDGDYVLRRLPAAEDPMVARMQAVREREYTLADTLNEYYANLYYQLGPPYADWRKMSREEMIRYQDLRRSAFIRGAAGVAAILAAVLYESQGGDNTAITMTGVFAGIEGIKSAFGKSAEAGMSREALEELGESFNAEAEPVVVEIEGQTRRLQGTAEERYRQWRQLLHEIYRSETGEPVPLPAPVVAPPGSDGSEPGDGPVAGAPAAAPAPVN